MARAYRFFLDPENSQNRLNLDSKEISITDPEILHQLTNVLRMHKDSKEKVSFFDNSGLVYETQIKDLEQAKKQGQALFTILDSYESKRELDREITFFLSVIKIDRFEFMVQKLTELGVQRMIPLCFERSQKQNIDKLKSKSSQERLKKIMIEATEQCEGAKLPELLEPIDFTELAKYIQAGDLSIYAYEELAGQKTAVPDISKATQVNLLVGPEGGITDNENKMLMDQGFCPLSLGRRLLKAETAALSLFSSLLL